MMEDLENLQQGSKASSAWVFDLSALRKPGVAIPAAIITVLLVLGGIWLYHRQANIRWAEEVALPRIERLAETSWSDYTELYALAEQAEEYIPDNPNLAALIDKSSLHINISTEPEGATVYMKEYDRPDSEWIKVGISPIDSIRVPIGIFRWKVEMEGYETVLAAAPTWAILGLEDDLISPNHFRRKLDKQESIPEGMVRVTGAQTPVGYLDDFFIDRYEVTNRAFKEFIDSGGYKRKEFWKHEFIKEGRVLSREEALSEFVDQTERPGPSTWQAGNYPDGQGDYPVSGISWYEAAAYAAYRDKHLPSSEHWGLARGENSQLIRWPQLGGYAVFAPFSNFGGNGPIAAGTLPGYTSYGAFDMAGNVREWCWNTTPMGRLIRGGAWNDNTYTFSIRSQAPPFDRSPKNGVRLAYYPDIDAIPESAFSTVNPGVTKDYGKMTPVSDEIFQVYKTQFEYDRTRLNERVVSRDEGHESWVHEEVTFDAAYGEERVIAHLFLPKSTSPPYQTVIYFPGSASIFQPDSDNLTQYYEFPVFLSFFVKNRRAVLYPVYEGTFERREDGLAPIHAGDDSHRYTEFLIRWVMDFRRSVDYLETRSDIDSQKLAYYGMSWGGMLGAIIPAVEKRLKASILVAGSLFSKGGRPEASSINYVTRVETPTLMLNGKYDTRSPYEATIKPLFDLLGTPEEHKKLILYETDHIPPKIEYMKESLDWLDRYLGTVE